MVLSKKILPYLVFAFPVVIDTLNGMSKGASGEGIGYWGIIYRGLIILLSLKYVFNNSYSNYIRPIFLISFVAIFYHITCQDALVSDEFTTLSKVLYFYFILSLICCNKNFNNNIDILLDASICYGVVASLILMCSYIFRWGYSSYSDDYFGAKGFFIAMNDVGLCIIILNSLSFLMYSKSLKKRYLLYCSIMTLGASVVGSMACTFGTLVVIIAFIFSTFVFKYNDYKSSISAKILVSVLIFLFVSYVVAFVANAILNDAYLSSKYSDIGSNIFELSGRSYLIDVGLNVIKQFNLPEILFGIGNRFNYIVGHELGYSFAKGVESDPYDLIGYFGYPLTMLLMWLPIKFLFKSIKNYISKKTITSYWSFVILFLFIGHAIYGGHAYTSPLVLPYISIVIYIINKESKSKKSNDVRISQH